MAIEVGVGLVRTLCLNVQELVLLMFLIHRILETDYKTKILDCDWVGFFPPVLRLDPNACKTWQYGFGKGVYVSCSHLFPKFQFNKSEIESLNMFLIFINLYFIYLFLELIIFFVYVNLHIFNLVPLIF